MGRDDAQAVRLSALILDVEGTRRDELREILLGEDDLVAGVQSAGFEPEEWYAETPPDIVFVALDTAPAAADHLSRGFIEGPLLVGVSAQSADAYRAFEIGAGSFLLHPPTTARVRHVLEIGRTRMLLTRLLNKVEGTASAQGEAGERRAARMVRVKVGRRYRYVPAAEIIWMEAEGNYVRIHLRGESHLLRVSLSGLLEELDADRFRQVHRSSVINVEWLRELEPWGCGDYVAILADGAKVRVSRGFAEAVFRPLL